MSEKKITQHAALPNISVGQIEKARLERDFKYFVEKAWPEVDPSAQFKMGWHIAAIAEHLELARDGKIDNLLINVPPRTGKSTLVSVMFHAWWWATEPDIQFLGASYSSDISIRDAVRARGLMQSEWYRKKWNSWNFSGDQNQKNNYMNDKHGRRQSTSVSGSLTGLGGRVLLLDDPHNASEADSDSVVQTTINWYREGFSSRGNDPNNTIKIIIMQRLSERDLSGYILNDSHEKFHHLCLPMMWSEDTHCVNVAIGYEDPRKKIVEEDPLDENKRLLWPSHIDMDGYKKLKDAFGTYGAAGQLDQRPAPRGGGLMKDHYFSIAPAVPKRWRRMCRAWDTAGSTTKQADYSVGVLLAEDYNGFYYILDIVRVREKSSDVYDRIKRTAYGDGVNTDIVIEQEPGASGKMAADIARKTLAGFKCHIVAVSKNKISRFMPFLPIIEAGRVKLVAGKWNKDFISEAIVWPGGKHDDQIDAFGLAIGHIATHKTILVA